MTEYFNNETFEHINFATKKREYCRIVYGRLKYNDFKTICGSSVLKTQRLKFVLDKSDIEPIDDFKNKEYKRVNRYKLIDDLESPVTAFVADVHRSSIITQKEMFVKIETIYPTRIDIKYIREDKKI